MEIAKRTIEDLITATSHFTKMTWTLATPSKATQISENVMLLEKDGKKLYLQVEGLGKIKWNVRPAISSYSFDSENDAFSSTLFRFTKSDAS